MKLSDLWTLPNYTPESRRLWHKRKAQARARRKVEKETRRKAQQARR